jgi:carboxymethylenebutenolidase
MGFCLGGKLAYRLASQFNLNATICYYPVGLEKHLEEAKRVRCETAIHFAELDHFVPLASVEKVVEGLADRPNFHIYQYEGVDHGFNCDARDSYNKQAADLAWSRSIDILTKELMG